MNKQRVVGLKGLWLAVLALVAQPGPALAQAGAPSIIESPESQVVMATHDATLSVVATGAEPLSYQWRFEGVALPEALGAVLILPNVTSNQAGHYSVVVRNPVGSVTSAVATLTVVPPLPGARDGSFAAFPGSDDVVRVVLPQADGKILIGGFFSTVHGVARQGVARLEADGRLDPTFDAKIEAYGAVYSLARQSDGKVLIGGSFATLGGVVRYNLARVNPDGSLDAGFAPFPGPNGTVWSIVAQSDGRVVIGGDFSQVGGTNRFLLARLHNDGQLDTSFAPSESLNGQVRCLALDAQGKLLAAGALRLGYSPPQTNIYPRVARFNTDGSLDTSFAPVVTINYFWDAYIFALAVQPDGAILMGGAFTSVNGQPRARLARVLGDGLLDASFNPAASASDVVTSLALQRDGRIVIGGGFSLVNGQPRERVARLNSDGTLDLSFQTTPGPNNWVEAVAMQGDDRILIGGNFDAIGEVACGRVARLVAADPPPFAPIISQSPVGQTVNEGTNVVFRVTGIGFPPPMYSWRLNGASVPGASGDKLELFNVRPGHAGSYTVVLSNAVGAITSAVAVLVVNPAPVRPGAPDIDFYTGSGPNWTVNAVACEPNGNLLLGGGFSQVDAVARPNLARLRSDGSLDPNFNPPALLANLGLVFSLVLQPDGRILAGGQTRTTEYGHWGPQLVRFNSDGTLDTNFFSFSRFFALSWGTVRAVATGTNGVIYVGGWFQHSVMRLQTNGFLDTNFNAGLILDSFSGYGTVSALAVQSDGKVLIGGEFSSVNGLPRNRLARLNPNGTVDETFNVGSGANSAIACIALQGNGQIVVAGQFSRFNGRPRSRVARLESDGTLDPTFDPGPGPNQNLSALVVQADGSLLVGGWFTAFGGWPGGGIVRLRSDGSVDLSYNPGSGANGAVWAIAREPDGQVVIGGDFTLVNGVPRNRVARLLGGPVPSAAPRIASEPASQVTTAGADVTFRVLASGVPAPSYEWQYSQFPVGANQWWLTLYNVQPVQGGPYRVRVNNPLGSALSAVAWLTVNLPAVHAGAPDLGFYAGFGPNDLVHAALVQPDRRIVVAGEFTEVDGTPRQRLARLDPNGSLDPSFDPGLGANGAVYALGGQSDGRVLVGGQFTSLNGVKRLGLARLNPDGSLDSSFDPGTNVNGTVYALVVQPDHRILVGGSFAAYYGAHFTFIARLNPDGSADPSFTPSPVLNSTVRCIALQANGAIVVGGDFSYYDRGISHYYLARLDRFGALDPSFLIASGPNLPVQCVAVQPDGKILLGGQFYAVNGVSRNGLARLGPDGALDPGFGTGSGLLGTVYALALRADGRVVVAGSFTTVGGLEFNRLVRFNGNGSVDLTFEPGLGVTDGTTYFDEYGDLIDRTTVRTVATAPDGTLIIGGDFSRVNGMSRNFLARVFNRDPALRIEYRSVSAPPGRQLELFWESGRLQQANQVTGPWTDVPGSASPYLAPLGSPPRFFRLRVP